MVGVLPALLDLDRRYILGGQYMLGLARLPLSEYRRMLQQPDLIRGVGVTLGGELPHGFQRELVVHQPQMSDYQLGHQSTMCTWPVALRSACSCCSCCSLVARMISRRDWKRPFLLSCTTSLSAFSAGSWRRTTSSTCSSTPSAPLQITLIG